MKVTGHPLGEAGPTVDARSLSLGILFMVLVTLTFTGLDACAKYLSAELPTSQIVWMRFVSHTLILTIVTAIILRGRVPYRSKRPGLQFMRAGLMSLTTLLNFMALKTMQLAETNAIFFTAPMFVAALSGPMLGEWAGPRRWAAIIVGFLGVLIIVQPGTGNFSWPALYVLAASFIYAVYNIMTRQLAGTDDPVITFLMTPLIGTLIFAPLGIASWVAPPDLLHWVLLAAMGIFGGIGHGCLLLALRRTPATILAPFSYIQLVWMSLAGYLIFADIPTIWTAIGASIVVACGLYVWFRERQAATKPTPPLTERQSAP
ncbi:MAG: DMT family transporter [Pseudomonadota bacterium]